MPLTSIQCWHVHCEECWLRTLVRLNTHTHTTAAAAVLTHTHTHTLAALFCRAALHDTQLLQPHFIVSEFLSALMPNREKLKWNISQMTCSLIAHTIQAVQTLLVSVGEELRWNGPQKAC